jgi:hypothetical protein
LCTLCLLPLLVALRVSRLLPLSRGLLPKSTTLRLCRSARMLLNRSRRRAIGR